MQLGEGKACVSSSQQFIIIMILGCITICPTIMTNYKLCTITLSEFKMKTGTWNAFLYYILHIGRLLDVRFWSLEIF